MNAVILNRVPSSLALTLGILGISTRATSKLRICAITCSGLALMKLRNSSFICSIMSSLIHLFLASSARYFLTASSLPNMASSFCILSDWVVVLMFSPVCVVCGGKSGIKTFFFALRFGVRFIYDVVRLPLGGMCG